jgi:hypothetical protein
MAVFVRHGVIQSLVTKSWGASGRGSRRSDRNAAIATVYIFFRNSRESCSAILNAFAEIAR